MEKQDFMEIGQEMAGKHAEESVDDFETIEEKEQLFEIADDAWHHAAIPDLEYMFDANPKTTYAAMGIDIHEQIEKFNLSSAYCKTFVSTIIKKYKLEM